MEAQQTLTTWLVDALDGAEAALDSGWSLPNVLQGSTDLLAFEQAHIFERGWTLAGRASDWPAVGSRHVLSVGRVPVVVVRDTEGTLRAFVNLCRHRGHPLADAEKTGPGRLLTCQYHAWAYDLRGQLVRAPGLDLDGGACPANSASRSDRAAELALRPVRLETWRGLVFVTLSDEAPALASEFVPAAAAPGEADILAYSVHHRDVLRFAADWKRVQDNVVECYHCAGVHAQTLERMYRAEAFHEAGWQGRCRYGRAELRDYPGVHHSVQLFPGTLVFLDPVVGLLARIRPDSTDTTTMDVTYLAAPDADPALVDRFIALWAETLAEDRIIVAAQHAALASGMLPHGRLVPGREDAVIGVQKLVLAAYRQGLAKPHVQRRPH